jgi:hypothetical protein
MINVWLDDVRDPARFRPGEDWHWCKTNTEFIRILDEHVLEIGKIALDHDKDHMILLTKLREMLGLDKGEELDIVADFVCDETYEPSYRFLALWAAFYNKVGIEVEIITSNTSRTPYLKELLSERFIVTVNPGGKKK